MAKLTLKDITTNRLTSINNYNSNNDLIETAIENTLSRDGTTPNQMEAVLDMNSNAIINLPVTPTGNAHAASKAYVDAVAAGSLTVRSDEQVATLAELKARAAGTADQSVYMISRTTVGDGGGGHFAWVVGDQSSNVTLDPGNGIWVPPDADPTGASGAWRRSFDGVIDLAFYGFNTANSAADNTTAANYAFSYLRSVFAGGDITSAGEPPCAIRSGPGVFNVNEIDATQIRSRGWRWDAYGTELLCATAGTVVLNLTHSRGYSIRNLSIRGDESTPPRRGFQTGYLQDAVSSGDWILDNCHTFGSFTECAIYNGGSEECLTLKCRFRNSNSGSNSYSMIADGFNWWGKHSSYYDKSNGNHYSTAVTSVSAAATATVTAPGHGFTVGQYVRFSNVTGGTDVDDVGTLWQVATVPDANTFTIASTNGVGGTGGEVWRAFPVSFLAVSHEKTAFFKDNGGPVIWSSSNHQNATYNVYTFSPNGNHFHYFFEPILSQNYPSNCIFDVIYEGDTMQHSYYFDWNSTPPARMSVSGWEIRTHETRNNVAFFGTNLATLDMNFLGINLDVAVWANSDALVDTPARYTLQGNITLRDTGGTTSIPVINGSLTVPDPMITLLPEGSYKINTRAVNGNANSNAIMKGEHVFYGDSASVALGAFTSEPKSSVSGDLIVAPYFRSGRASVADDTAISFACPGLTPSCIVVFSTITTTYLNGMYFFRASGSPQCIALSSGGTPADVTTGALTGTTGVNGNVTVSAHSDGNIYVENRSGVTLIIAYTVLNDS